MQSNKNNFKKLLIVGSSSFGQVVRAYFEEFTEYKVIAYACHEKYKNSDNFDGLPLISIENIESNFSINEIDVFVAIGYKGMNSFREKTFNEIKSKGFSFATFIYPDVKIWPSSKIGENVFIFEDNTIQPFTEIGNNSILWSGNHIGHHSEIGENCFISSHVVISGSCKLGNNIFIGVNATLHDCIELKDNVLVGAGAIISKDTNIGEVFIPPSTKVFPKNSNQLRF